MCVSLLHKVSTGCEEIDKILGGGFPSGSVSLIYGEAETGKTTLAIQCAANSARQGYKSLFVDCDGTFSTQRLSQVASRDLKSVARSIILMKPSNFSEQSLVITSLTDYVTKGFGLVVVDTVTSLYRFEIADHPGRTFELNRELNRQMASLTQFAKSQKMSVLLISQVRDVFNGAYVSIEPVGTRVLKFWAETIMFVKPTEDHGVFKVVLERGPEGFRDSFCHVRIEKTGIH